MKKSLIAVAAILFATLAADTSTAGVRIDNYWVGVDSTSIFNVQFSEPTTSLDLTPAQGTVEWSTPQDCRAPCAVTLDYLVVTFDNFSVTVDITNAAGSLATADVDIASPTVGIMGPITLESTGGSGYLIPSGTNVSISAGVSGTSGSLTISPESVGGITQLTSSTAIPINIGTVASPSVTIDARSLPFTLNMEGTVGGEPVTADLTGSISIEASGLTPYNSF
jgi:hypothetical protein